MRLIRSLISLAVILTLVVIGATVKLGDNTFFEHVKNIWDSDETQELVEGAKEKGGPVFERVKRGVEAGVKEATTDDPKAGDPKAGDPKAGDPKAGDPKADDPEADDPEKKTAEKKTAEKSN